MKQAIMTAPGQITFHDADQPETPPGHVLMQTRRIGVCGSDIHVYYGQHPYTGYPVIQGHEVAGVVAAVGADVHNVRIRDKMTFMPQLVCGECHPCQHGLYHICENLKVMGFQADGAAQEYFLLPAWNVIGLPADMPLDYGAMIEPIAVAVHALRRGGMVAGQRVLVLGAGTIGNLVAQVARAFGAHAVMSTDVSDYKLAMAARCDIDFVINTARDDLDAAIRRDFGPARADLILECVGVQETVSQAVACARKGTTIVIVGVFGQAPVVDLGLVQDRELSLVGTLMYQKADYEAAIELVTSGKLNLDKLITHRFSFDQYPDAYEAIEQSNGQYMKVMIDL